MIQPINSRVLIELRGKYKHVNTTEEKFGTSKTEGVVVAISKGALKEADAAGEVIKIGQRAFFGKYEDTAPYNRDGKDYALIKYEDVTGVEDE